MTRTADCGFELAPWQRAVRLAGLVVSGAGLAVTVTMAFAILFPNVALFREPPPLYSAPWTDIQLEYLPACFIFAVLFASLIDLFFTPQAWVGKDWGKLSIRWAGLFAIVVLPFMLLDQSNAEDYQAGPFVSVMLVVFACALCLLLVLVWPVVGPRVKRPRGFLDSWELLIIGIMALAYPVLLVQAALQGSSSALIVGAGGYLALISGGMHRTEPQVRAKQGNGGAHAG